MVRAYLAQLVSHERIELRVVREQILDCGSHCPAQLESTIDLAATEVEVRPVLGRMVVPVDEYQALQRHAVLPRISVPRRELLFRQAPNQLGSLCAESCCFRDEPVPHRV